MKKYQNFYQIFHCLVVKFTVNLNRCVFVMTYCRVTIQEREYVYMPKYEKVAINFILKKEDTEKYL